MLSFGAPLFLWALLGIPLVILLHFLRARRRRHEVSALFLWRRAKELSEQRRRFSPSWLLALQLAFVTLAALGLAQPQLDMSGAPDRILVVDASASMAAGGRLDAAVVQAKEFLRGAGRVALIRAGLDATVAQPLTADHGEVRAALDALVAADARAELGRALELARSLSPGAEVHLFSDVAAPPGAEAVFHPVGSEARNLGISAFELRNRQAFVSVVSNDPRPQEVTLELRRAGEPVASTTLLVPAGGQANVGFPLTASGFYQAALGAPAWDALALDNVAYAGSRDLRVLVNPTMPELERALSAIPNLELRRVSRPPANSGAYDVRVVEGLPEAEPAPGRTLYVAPPSPDAERRQIRDWDRTDPLLRFVDFSGFEVGLAPELPPLPGEGWRVLAQTEDLTPVILRRQTPRSDEIVWRFHPSQADVQRLAFPILLINIMDAFQGENRLEMGSLLPEDTPTLVNGESRRLARASLPGVYRLNEAAYSVSLLSEDESRLPVPSAAPAQTAGRPEDSDVTRSERRRSLALWLVLLAVLLLAGEWLLWTKGRQSWMSQG